MSILLRIARVRTLFNSFLVLGAFFILGAGSAFAAAPQGTMTGSVQSVTAGTANAINTLTVTDHSTAEIVTGNDIRITIPAALNAIWDSTDTTATLGGTASAKASTTVSYANANRTLVIDVTTNFANSDTLQISGLSIVAEAVSSATALQWAIDAGGATNGTANVNTALTITVGDLTSTNIEPAILVPSILSNNTITFITTASIPNLGIIKVTYPTGWDLTQVSGSTASSLSGLDGTWTATVSGQVVTLTQTGGGTSSAGTKSFVLASVRTPAFTGSGGTYTLLTEKSDGTDIETATVTADTLSGSGDTDDEDNFENITSVSVEDYASGGVKISWTETDDDATFVQIYKGISPNPVDGTAYAIVSVGTEYYVDANVEEGDEVTYMLRATSGSAWGDYTDEVTFTVGSGETSGSDDDTTTDTSTDDDTDTDTSTDDDTTTDTSTDEEVDDDLMEDPAPTVFSDISGHWGENAIEAMVSAGVVEGYEDGTFDPNGNLNRAEAAALLWRVLGAGDPEDAGEDPFDDVEMSEWYASYIAGLKYLELVDGNPNGTYEPSEEINRAEFLKLAVNVWEYMGHTDEGYDYDVDTVLGEAYEDVDSSEWYSATVAWATVAGYVSGSDCAEGTCFYAGNSITRAEATQILYNMFEDMLQ